MSYPPKQHQDSNKKHLIHVIRAYPLATVISVSNNKPLITHIPLIYKNNELIGHLDAHNPHAALLKNQNKVTVIFSGPQCYISPSIYTTKQLPTWNYVKVHVEGVVSEIKDPESIKQTMVAMTEFLEQPHHNYTLDKDDPDMDTYLPYVSGFKITITHWEGKFKLSQNRQAVDFEIAKSEMIKRNEVHLGDFLNQIIH